MIARNCKYANLILYNMHVIVHFLPKKNCFHPQKYFFLPKVFQKCVNRDKIAYVMA